MIPVHATNSTALSGFFPREGPNLARLTDLDTISTQLLCDPSDCGPAGLLKSGKYGKRGPYNKSGGHPGDRKHHAKGSKAAKAATKKGALGVGARALKGAVPDVDMHAQDADAASRASPEPGPEDYDELYGCPKCRFSKVSRSMNPHVHPFCVCSWDCKASLLQGLSLRYNPCKLGNSNRPQNADLYILV